MVEQAWLVRVVADWVIYALIILAAIVLLRVTPNQVRVRTVAQAIAVILIAYLLAQLIRPLYGGERPFMALGVEPGAWAATNSGFPSEHTLLAFGLTFIIWVVSRNMALTVMAVGLSVAIALARVIALVHTPLDILAGLLCAVAAAVFIYGKNIFKVS